MTFLRGPERGALSKLNTRKAIGIKIVTLGLILGVAGALTTAYVNPLVGKIMFFLGFAAFFVGLLINVSVLMTGNHKKSEE